MRRNRREAASSFEPTAVALDGAPPNRFVAVAFDDAEKAKAWYASPAIKEVSHAPEGNEVASLFGRRACQVV